jgi:hypothetical protein
MHGVGVHDVGVHHVAVCSVCEYVGVHFVDVPCVDAHAHKTRIFFSVRFLLFPIRYVAESFLQIKGRCQIEN